MERLAVLGQEYVDIMDRMKDLEERRTQIKEEISSILEAEGTSFMVVPNGVDTLLKFKKNFRATKSFDKDGLAKEIGWDREDIDYAGVSKAVEGGYVNSSKVATFQAVNKSTFVTVRAVKAKPNKKG